MYIISFKKIFSSNIDYKILFIINDSTSISYIQSPRRTCTFCSKNIHSHQIRFYGI